MKKTLILALFGALVLSGVAAFAGDQKTIKAEVLDLKCYANGMSGSGHAGCAARCLKSGGDMGLLADGEVYTVDREGSDAEAIKALEALGGKMAEVEAETMKTDDGMVAKVSAAKAAG